MISGANSVSYFTGEGGSSKKSRARCTLGKLLKCEILKRIRKIALAFCLKIVHMRLMIAPLQYYSTTNILQ